MSGVPRTSLRKPRGRDAGGKLNEPVSIRPGVGMLGLFPHMKYQPWYALGELVDNGIQSYLTNRDRLRDTEGNDYGFRVEIEIDQLDGGSIVVRDNAAGIAQGDWRRAFLVAEPPADSSGLSQYGIGMKAACCWFAKNWSLRTTYLGEDTIRSVAFDIPEIVASRTETLEVVEEPTDWRSHFTEIRMTNLYRAPQRRTLGKIREYLGGIYRQFLRNGDVEILVNGQAITYSEPPVLEAPPYSNLGGGLITWRKDVTLRLRSGRRVHGFVAIRETGSTSMAGLALFYRQKVVMGAGEDTYRPEEIFGRSNSFSYQRVFGEMHMDDFDVTYTKDALVWSDEEDEFIELLKAEMDAAPMPILRQAENHRSRQVAPTPVEVAGTIVKAIASAFTGVGDGDQGVLSIPATIPMVTTDDFAVDGDGNSRSLPSAGEQLQTDQDLELDVRGDIWSVALRLVSDEGNLKWLTVLPYQDGKDRRLSLTVNQAHPFMRAFCELPGQELEPVWRVAIALGLAQELARKGGAKMPALVTSNVNELLRSVLSKKV